MRKQDRLKGYSRLVDMAGSGEVRGDALTAMRLPEPERRLMFAVLASAIIERDAWWVAGIGGLGPFTFEEICDYLGFDRQVLGIALLSSFASKERLRMPRWLVAPCMGARGREPHGHRRKRLAVV